MSQLNNCGKPAANACRMRDSGRELLQEFTEGPAKYGRIPDESKVTERYQMA